jgi:sulfate adenylyltransferase
MKPCGNTLVNLLVDENRQNLLKKIALNLPDIILNTRQLFDLELLANGALSPLKGFMNGSDYESVLDRMRLQDNMLWPVPVCLDISETISRRLEVGQSLALRDPEGFLLAILHIEDIWPVDPKKEAI